MARETTGEFNDAMLEWFKASKGAFTVFTQTELNKGTYNVKSVIRELLIEKLGRENIPVVNITERQSIQFRPCEKAKIYQTEALDIPCKFSKKDKDEMTIYFRQEIINLFNAEANDIWYVYFLNGIKEPIIGIMSSEKWHNLFDEIPDDQMEPDELGTHELNYLDNIGDIKFEEVDAPERKLVQKIKSDKTMNSVSAEEAARREKNRKKKGDRGEEIAIEIEKHRLKNLGREDLVPKITHVAKKKDGLGYDIISTDLDEAGKEQEIYIEVKTTAGDINTPFYVSTNELKVSRKYKDLYYIYRIFNMTEKTTDVQYYRMRGAIDENYDLVPMDYLAYRRQIEEE